MSPTVVGQFIANVHTCVGCWFVVLGKAEIGSALCFVAVVLHLCLYPWGRA